MLESIRIRPVIGALFFFFLCAGFACAADDGFGAAQKAQGEHFSVYCAPGLNLSYLARQLNMGISDKLLASTTQRKSAAADTDFTGMLDTLYAQVSDLLDMHLYDYKVTIKICRDYKQLNGIYRQFFGTDLATYSFYVNDQNTIYVSEDNFKLTILGHELAHAIISHYFVVAPPVKIHEILAMYVEYQLRKEYSAALK